MRQKAAVFALVVDVVLSLFPTADCPKLQGGDNIVLTNEALLMNTFPDGVIVSLECANGYVPESGSGTMQCQGQAWSTLDLKCKSESCLPYSHLR